MPEVLITDRDSLKTAIASWINRSDLTDEIGNFIQNAEVEFDDDDRIRKLKRTTLTVDAEPESGDLPDDFESVESLSHEGPTYFGELEEVDHAELAHHKALYGDTGVPSFYAQVDGSIYFAPESDGSYDLALTYWASLPSLSTTDPNWLLTERPDIYLYGALVEAAPFLKDDERVGTWVSLLDAKIEKFHKSEMRKRFSGRLVRRPRTIGE